MWRSVVLPDPEGPMKVTKFPRETENVRFSRTSGPPGYRKERFRASMMGMVA
jgi:hypothetical protein